MIQNSLFETEKIIQDDKYTSKIKTPVYEPKNIKPHVLNLFDDLKTKKLIAEINNADITDDEKKFLIEAAKRHTVFNYSKIADYYAHATKEMQYLMERSALIIIDFEKAYINGYIRLASDMADCYGNNYDE